MDGNDSARSTIRRIEREHLTSAYSGVSLAPSVDVKELIMVRYVVNVNDTHFDVLVGIREIVLVGMVILRESDPEDSNNLQWLLLVIFMLEDQTPLPLRFWTYIFLSCS